MPLIGPPGSGMLARRLPTILPQMTLEESIETTKIHSIAGLVDGNGLITTRPYRSPHHTVSELMVAFLGEPSIKVSPKFRQPALCVAQTV